MSRSTQPDNDFGWAAPATDSVDKRRTEEAVAGALFGLGAAVEVGRFSLLERCGSGAMGIVYSAWDPRLNRKVAIKVLRESGDDMGRILREARAAASLGHPNTVTVYDADEDAGRSYIAMEFIDGLTLGPWLEAQTRSLDDVRDVFAQLARGLHAAHCAGLIHRDFKPANVMISWQDGRNLARVLDFGLTVPACRGGEERIAGTPAYMAPEVRLGEPPTAASDQYSFFVALYEALTGSRPRKRPAPLEAVPRGLRSLILVGLSEDPARRHPSMADVAEALAPARSRMSLWGMGVVALAGGIGIAVSSQHADGPDPCAHPEAAWTEAVGESDLDDGRLRAAFGRYRDAWVEARTTVCEATFHDGAQSQELLEVRNACLQSAAFATGALASSVVEEPSRADRALSAVSALPSPRDCARAKGEPDPPSEPLERALALMNARLGMLEWSEATEAASTLAALPEGSSAQEVRRHLLTSTALERTGARVEAVASLDAAVELAVTHEQPASAAEVAVEKIWTLGVRNHDLDAARDWERLGQAWLEVAGLEGGITSARLRDRLGAAAAVVDELDEAQQLHREALDIIVAAVGEAAPETVPFRVHLHGVLPRTSDEAQALRRDTRALIERYYGPEHPVLAVLLVGGQISFERPGECQRALPDYEEALRIKTAHYGPRSPEIIPSLTSLANCQAAAGDPRGASVLLRQAIEIREHDVGRDSPALFTSLFNLAIAEMDAEEHELALAHAQRALTLRARTVGDDSPRLFAPMLAVGMAQARLGRSDDALETFASTMALEDPTSTGAFDRVEARLEYGRALARDGQAAASSRMYAEALAVTETSRDSAVRALYDEFDRGTAP